MLVSWRPLILSSIFVSPIINAEPDSQMIGVTDIKRAEYNWTMHCLGCHQEDATGSWNGAPNMVGEVAKFLSLKEGREFLGRVPGVAFVELSDHEVAELLNWLVQEFDEVHMPENFRPYTAVELKDLRSSPLISEVFDTRQNIMERLEKQGE